MEMQAFYAMLAEAGQAEGWLADLAAVRGLALEDLPGGDDFLTWDPW
jgi:hypothetical protein